MSYILTLNRKLQSCLIQLNFKNQSSSFSSIICSAIPNTRFPVEGYRTSRFRTVNRAFSYSRANQDGVLGIPTLSHPSRCTLFFSSLFLPPLLLLLLDPSSTFPASEPGASDQMEFFHFIFPALCTISNSIVPVLSPARFRAVFHVHTRTFVFLLAVR